jgi:cytosine/adenosine deaminase-related metal-dependent hydrolase
VDGRISAVRPHGDAADVSGAVSADPEDAESAPIVIDGEDRLALPTFTDAHVHLDSTRLGLPFRPHSTEPGPLWNQIANDRENWRDAGAPVDERATFTLGRAIVQGMTRARAYAQVDADCGLERLEGVLAARETFRDRTDVQIVAFPQAGLLLEPGVPDLIHQAMSAGADVVGGIDPCALDKDPVRHLDIVFDLAERHHADVDIHLHEPGQLGLFTVERILERVRVLDYRGRVTVAHAFHLGDLQGAVLDTLIEQLAELDVAVTTIAPSGRGPLPLTALREAGVRVGLGQDGQRDYWSPYGNADMLDRTWQLAFTNGMRRENLIEQALEVATLGGARVIDPAAFPAGAAGTGGDGGPAVPGLQVGDPADLVLLPAETPTSAVMDRPVSRTVIRAGRVIAVEGALVGEDPLAGTVFDNELTPGRAHA